MDARTVLLVDADRDSLTIYSLILEHRGFRVLRACGVEEGLELARCHLPDLVVCELLGAPGEAGTMVERIRDDPDTEHLRVLAVTSIPVRSVEFAPVLALCDGYLSKPCAPTRVLEEVGRLIGARSAIPA